MNGNPCSRVSRSGYLRRSRVSMLQFRDLLSGHCLCCRRADTPVMCSIRWAISSSAFAAHLLTNPASSCSSLTRFRFPSRACARPPGGLGPCPIPDPRLPRQMRLAFRFLPSSCASPRHIRTRPTGHSPSLSPPPKNLEPFCAGASFLHTRESPSCTPCSHPPVSPHNV
jgi:hypothetical protein